MARQVASPPAGASPGSGMQVCVNCGGGIFYSVSMSSGSRWIHDGSFVASCPKGGA